MNQRWNKLRRLGIKVVLGIILGRFVIQPFVTAIFWIQYRDQIEKTYFQTLYEQYRDPPSAVSAFEIFLAYTVLGLIIVLAFSKFTSIRQSQKRTQELLQQELNANIEHLIESGESDSVEFKSSLRWDVKQNAPNKALDKSVAKTMAAFLNSEGGVLVIGVDDSGQVLGLEQDIKMTAKKNLDGFELVLTDLISTRLGDSVASLIRIVFHQIGGKDICRLMIAASRRPVYVNENQSSKFYIRSGASTRELNVQEAVKYISSSKSFDKKYV